RHEYRRDRDRRLYRRGRPRYLHLARDQPVGSPAARHRRADGVGARHRRRSDARTRPAAADLEGHGQRGAALIRLEHLTKVFRTRAGDISAVEDVNFELPEGEICVLLGPSGCGKTTTLKMINRLVQPTSGKIYINGLDTDAADSIQLRRTIGY